MTFQRQDMDASLLRHAQRFPKLRVGSVIGLKAGHALHLDDEHDPRSETLCLGGDQPFDVLDATFGRCVWEFGHAVFL